MVESLHARFHFVDQGRNLFPNCFRLLSWFLTRGRASRTHLGELRGERLPELLKCSDIAFPLRPRAHPNFQRAFCASSAAAFRRNALRTKICGLGDQLAALFIAMFGNAIARTLLAFILLWEGRVCRSRCTNGISRTTYLCPGSVMRAVERLRRIFGHATAPSP